MTFHHCQPLACSRMSGELQHKSVRSCSDLLRSACGQELRRRGGVHQHACSVTCEDVHHLSIDAEYLQRSTHQIPPLWTIAQHAGSIPTATGAAAHATAPASVCRQDAPLKEVADEDPDIEALTLTAQIVSNIRCKHSIVSDITVKSGHVAHAKPKWSCTWPRPVALVRSLPTLLTQ